ncbi:pyridoxal phosphate-dependent aminotransferase [Floricoccus penangensis]|uniref:Aminotransferase n=1 Tax=Floricoccus penangensis TaxID=1859475 RepID=A0A9Q5JHH0_9LACT|nr:pyridoxal phosphate-dependent aminotransferase [Floricoccus penangensis]OFI47605.1 aspartate aminotransferase [Floricoccus penangensis]URZ87864.1 pyridoxal phosphate-dependent aminotransferase [Floricoccus penangensis]
MILSDFVNGIEESVTLAAAAKAKELKAAGHDVLILTVGEPDFPTPTNINTAAKKAIDTGKTSFYTPASGLPELKKAVNKYFEDFYGYSVSPKEVIVTSGAKFAIYAFFMSVLNKGDEVIIPTPYWVSYSDQVKMASGVPVFVEGRQENDFKVTLEQVEAARTDKTKVLLINSPSNPSGMIYTEEELRELGNWAVEHNILILSDDIYHRLVYNGSKTTMISTISDEIRKQTIVINGLSKSYSMTGWRIGFATGNPEIIAAMAKIASQTTSNPTAVAQYAAIEAINGDQSVVDAMRGRFEERLNTIYPILNEIPGIEVVKPQGAFYLFPNVKGAMEMTGYDNVTDFTDALLEKEGVALVTGDGFGAPENVRLSYATDMYTILEALDRIKRFIENNTK